MHFIDIMAHLIVRIIFFLHIFKPSNKHFMDNYLITLGMYLILMLFFKLYVTVTAKE